MQYETPPFPLGTTWYGGATIDSNALTGTELEGREWWFPDLDYAAAGPRPKRTGRMRLMRIVRNVGAIALLPGRLATFQLTAGMYGGRVDGYSDVAAERCYPIDEFLPAAGCPVNDLCWITVRGPANIKSALSDFTALLAVGDKVVAITAATSGATTAGRFTNQLLTGATALLADQAVNYIGYALTGRTTANTNTDTLIEVGKW